MKQTIILLLVFVALAGCSKGGNEEPRPGGRVPVTLSAGMRTVSSNFDSRAVIGNNTEFTAGIAGWEAPDAIAYTEASTWYATADI